MRSSGRKARGVMVAALGGAIWMAGTSGPSGDVAAQGTANYVITGSAVRNVVDQVDDISGPQVHLLYVLPSDGVDEHLDTNGTIARSFGAAQYWLRWQAGGRQFRLDTRAGAPDITFYRLSRTDAEMFAWGAFVRDQIESELTGAGLLVPGKIYLAYYGGGSSWACGGAPWPPTLPGQLSALYLKGTPPGFTCATNVLGGTSTMPAYWEFSAIHELLHSLGIAPACAPNHTLSGHTSDTQFDLMYAGASPWIPSVLDYGRNDYYGHGNPGCADLISNPYLAPAVPFDAPAGVTYYFNDMESGPGEMSGSAPWAITTEMARSGSRAWSDSPNAPYAANLNISLYTPVLNLSTATTPVLRFWQRRFFGDAVDAARIWITTNNGAVWTQLRVFRDNATDWTETFVDLSDYAGFSAVQMTFQITSNGAVSGDGWFIDDIEVREMSLVRNGRFTSGLTHWTTFAQPDASYLNAAVTNGVLGFHRLPAGPGVPSSGVVLQQTGVAVGAGEPLEAQFDLGNSSSVRKRVSVLIHDFSFSDLFVCTFWLEPNTALRTYGMRTHTTRAWTDATIAFYAATSGSDGGDYLLDNVSLRRAPQEAVDRTDCYDPTAPSAPGGSLGPELLVNGSFSTGDLLGWNKVFELEHRVVNGVLEFYRPVAASDPAGVILQQTHTAVPQGAVLTAQFDLGNTSTVRKRVTVLLHDFTFGDLSACTFWIEPGRPPSTHVMRAFTTRPWTNATIAFYAASRGDGEWIQLDNVSLRRATGGATHGTNCGEPVPAVGG